MTRRITFFLLTNLGVLLTIGLITNLLGLNHYLTAQGLDYTSLLIFCGIWGFAGSFISLLMSKVIAKGAMGVKVINPYQSTGAEAEIVQMVHDLSQKAGLEKMPEVGIFQSPAPNAFATGPSRKNSLVAVSTGLLNHMDRNQVRGVIGHEVAHIANGDMVTMTLIQGVVNAFTMFLARIVAFAVSSAMQGDNEERGPNPFVYMATTFVFDLIFTVLGSVVVNYYSRAREYRADEGGAQLAGQGAMVSALQALRQASNLNNTSDQRVAALQISGPRSWAALFSTHPPLEDRIARLQQGGSVSRARVASF